MSEAQLMDWAAAVTGDTIAAAGRFFPRGWRRATTASAMAAAAGEGAANAYGGPNVEGEGANQLVDEEAAERGYLLVAVSEAKVYVLRTSMDTPEGPSSFATERTFERENLVVKFHSRFGHRHLELENPDTGEHLELENTKHTQDAHTREVVDALTS